MHKRFFAQRLVVDHGSGDVGFERKTTMRMMAIILGAGLCWSAPADATTVMKLDRAQMTELSDAVVHVRVGTIRTVEQRPGALATLIELEVVESFKGKHERGAAITLLQLSLIHI